MGMMIAIKDIEMPKSCFGCPLHNYHFCDVKGIRIEEWWDNGQRAKDCPLVEAISKANVYKAIQEMMKYEHEGFINISLARLDEILKRCEVIEDGKID